MEMTNICPQWLTEYKFPFNGLSSLYECHDETITHYLTGLSEFVEVYRQACKQESLVATPAMFVSIGLPLQGQRFYLSQLPSPLILHLSHSLPLSYKRDSPSWKVTENDDMVI